MDGWRTDPSLPRRLCQLRFGPGAPGEDGLPDPAACNGHAFAPSLRGPWTWVNGSAYNRTVPLQARPLRVVLCECISQREWQWLAIVFIQHARDVSG